MAKPVPQLDALSGTTRPARAAKVVATAAKVSSRSKASSWAPKPVAALKAVPADVPALD
jgi:hypothetical protein